MEICSNRSSIIRNGLSVFRYQHHHDRVLYEYRTVKTGHLPDHSERDIAGGILFHITFVDGGQRYLAFIKKMPELFNSVPLKEIAGYIGVTPQSLSRIRAGVNKNKKAIL